jgi:hypothetical protein
MDAHADTFLHRSEKDFNANVKELHITSEEIHLIANSVSQYVD